MGESVPYPQTPVLLGFKRHVEEGGSGEGALNGHDPSPWLECTGGMPPAPNSSGACQRTLAVGGHPWCPAIPYSWRLSGARGVAATKVWLPGCHARERLLPAQHCLSPVKLFLLFWEILEQEPA